MSKQTNEQVVHEILEKIGLKTTTTSAKLLRDAVTHEADAAKAIAAMTATSLAGGYAPATAEKIIAAAKVYKPAKAAKSKATGNTKEVPVTQAEKEILSDLGVDITQLFTALLTGASVPSTMSDEALLRVCQPGNITHWATKELIARYGANPIIAYRPGTSDIAVLEVIKYLANIRAGFRAKKSLDVEGEPVELYSVGITPPQLVDENPLFPNEPLLEGVCEHTNVSYAGMPKEKQILLRLALDDHSLTFSNTREARVIIKEFADTDIPELRRMYRDTYIHYKSLDADGKLPTLKMRLKPLDQTQNAQPVQEPDERDYRDGLKPSKPNWHNLKV